MFKKLLVTLVAFLLAGACVLAAGAAAEPATGVRPIEADSPCPAVGCASGSCHGFDDVPEPDGVHEMTCPEASCASTECHAWDTLATRKHPQVQARVGRLVIARGTRWPRAITRRPTRA